MNMLALVALVGVVFASVFLLKIAERRMLQREMFFYRLNFPRDLGVEAVQSFVAGLSGLLLPWWKRWRASPFIVLEVHATTSGINHYLIVPSAWSQPVENILQASVPSVRYERIDPLDPHLDVGAEYRLSTSSRVLRIAAPDTSAKLLASLQPLTNNEKVVVQWVLTPHAPVAPVRVATGKESILPIPTRGVDTSEAASVLRQKLAHPLLLGAARIGISASTPERSRQLLRQSEASWHESRAPGVHLSRRMFSERAVASRIVKRVIPFSDWPGVFNNEELAGLIGWPVGAVSIPGLALGGCRLVAASPLIPRHGTVIADSMFPGDLRPLALDIDGRLRHVHLLGPTGTGKSTLIVNMVIQDMLNGYGCVVLDPKGDMVRDILERVPASRRADVIVLDPADTDRPVGFNPLHTDDADQVELVVENLVGLFKSLYRFSWGPRLDDILRAASMTVVISGQATLCEVPLILTDATYRRRLVGKLDDPVGLESFWGWYESISDAERQVALGPVMNKLRAVTMRPRVRAIIGQREPKLQLAEVMRSNKVLLVSLASGLLGEEAAALLGALVIAELWHATTARSGLQPSNRPPVMAHLDEWQHFLHLPTPMASVLAEARGLGLGLTLAHQHIGQLPDDARHAVLANARSRVVFQLAAEDARVTARVFGPPFTDQDLQGLGPFEVVTQLHAEGNTQPAATARTRPLPEPTSDADEIRRWSRQHFGVDRADVEADIRSRQSGRPDAPIGKRARRGGGSSSGGGS